MKLPPSKRINLRNQLKAVAFNCHPRFFLKTKVRGNIVHNADLNMKAHSSVETEYIELGLNDFNSLSSNQRAIINYLYKVAHLKGNNFKLELSEISKNSGVKLTSLRTTINRLSTKGFFDKSSTNGLLTISVTESNLEKHSGVEIIKPVSPKLKLVSVLEPVVSDTRHSEHIVNTSIESHGVKSASFSSIKNTIVSKAVLFKLLGVSLCFVFTYFLVEEGREFFTRELSTDFNPFALSLGFELLLLFLAGYKFKTKIKKTLASILLVSLFVFSVGSYSFVSISSSLKSFKSEKAIDEKLELLKNEIKEKTVLIKGYKQKGWVGEVRTLSREKQALTQKLLSLSEEGSNQLPIVFLVQLGLSLAFRFLIQVTNIFLIHELLG